MKVGAKIRVSYVGIILISVSIVLALVIDGARRDLKEKIGKDLQWVARLEAENLKDYIKERVSHFRIFLGEELLRSDDRGALTGYLSEIREMDPAFDDVSVLDRGGKTIASTDPKLVGNQDLLHKKNAMSFFRKAANAKKGNVFFKYVYGDKEKKELEGLILAPVMDKRGDDTIRILAATVNMDRILKPADRFGGYTVGGKTAYRLDNTSKMIITQEGEAQVFTPLVYIQADSDLRIPLKDGREGYVVYKDAEGRGIIAGYADMIEHRSARDEDWAVIAMAPQKEVFYPAIRLRNRMIILGVVAVIVAWIVAFFVARGISSPIRRLADVTDSIARGDLSKRADIRLNDEVGDLSRSFNKMTDELNMAIVSRDQEIIVRKNAEEKLKEEMEDKAKFISLISYEFKSSLTVIREGMGIVLSEIEDNINDKQKRLLVLAKRCAESLNRLIQDIVDYHKIETEETKFKMEENNINEVVADVKMAMAPLLAKKKQVEFIVETDNGLPDARFDREKITLVLTNIVNIALNFTEKGTVKIVTAREGDNAFRVSVKDSSLGIKKEDLPKLFEKFEAAGKNRDKKAGGTGMGLSISKEIITRHRGKIWAESEDGKGATFNFVLPIRERRR